MIRFTRKSLPFGVVVDKKMHKGFEAKRKENLVSLLRDNIHSETKIQKRFKREEVDIYYNSVAHNE